MTTSRRSPTSVTSVVRSSSTQGESSALTRVHSWARPGRRCGRPRPGRRGPPPCSPPARVLEVAEQDVDPPGQLRQLGDHPGVRRVEEVDHPGGTPGDLAQRGRRPDGERAEEVLGAAHAATVAPDRTVRTRRSRPGPAPTVRGQLRCRSGPRRESEHMTVQQGLTRTELTAWRTFLRAHATIVRALETDLLAEHDLPLASYDVLVQLSEAPRPPAAHDRPRRARAAEPVRPDPARGPARARGPAPPRGVPERRPRDAGRAHRGRGSSGCGRPGRPTCAGCSSTSSAA
jgi:hypothetical protein